MSHRSGRFPGNGVRRRINLIRLKDEYQNMAGDKLTGAAGYELPNIHGQKSGFGTDVLSTDLTHGDKYADLINVKGAKFLDLNRGSIKIDDADDLKEVLKENDVYMSIAFNDNPDNDEFRKAYIVVITDVVKRPTTPTTPTGTGKVELLQKGMGTISDDEIEVLSNGEAYATFTLNTPDFVKLSTAAAGKRARVTYRLEVDGKVAAFGTSTIGDIANQASPSNASMVANNATGSKVDAFTITRFKLAGSTSGTNYTIPAGATSVKMVIEKVEWGEVVVDFVDKNGDPIHLDADDDSSKTLLTNFGGATNAVIALNISEAWYDDSTMDYEIKGATNVTNAGKLSKTGEAITAGTAENLEPVGSDKFEAIGTSAVTVTVDKLTDLTNRTVELTGNSKEDAAFDLGANVKVNVIDEDSSDAVGEFKFTATGIGALNTDKYDSGKPGTKFAVQVECMTLGTNVTSYTVSFDIVDADGNKVGSLAPTKMTTPASADGTIVKTASVAGLTVADTDMKITNVKIVPESKETVTVSFAQNTDADGNFLKTGLITLTFSSDVQTFDAASFTIAAGDETELDTTSGAAIAINGKTVTIKVVDNTTDIAGNTANANDTFTVNESAITMKSGKAVAATNSPFTVAWKGADGTAA